MAQPTGQDDRAAVDDRYGAERVRQGRIVLRTRSRRIIFIAGLVGIVALVFVLRLIAG